MRYPVWIDVYILFLEFFDEAKTQKIFDNLSDEEVSKSAKKPEPNVEAESCEATPEAFAELEAADVATASNVEVCIIYTMYIDDPE